MDADAIRDLFRPLGTVTVRRMFGGAGIYRDGVILAIEVEGEIYLKADAHTVPDFRAAGSEPFVYDGKGKPVTMSYWRMPGEAYDDPDAFRPWGEKAWAAAQRAQAIKAIAASRRRGIGATKKAGR